VIVTSDIDYLVITPVPRVCPVTVCKVWHTRVHLLYEALEIYEVLESILCLEVRLRRLIQIVFARSKAYACTAKSQTCYYISKLMKFHNVFYVYY
jgi:hypothetical protein